MIAVIFSKFSEKELHHCGVNARTARVDARKGINATKIAETNRLAQRRTGRWQSGGKKGGRAGEHAGRRSGARPAWTVLLVHRFRGQQVGAGQQQGRQHEGEMDADFPP